MKMLFFFFSIFITSSLWAQEFACEKLIERNDQYTHCTNHVKNFSLPFHFFYPSHLDTSKKVFVDLHFHGHNLDGYSHFLKTNITGEGWGDFGSFLKLSNINGIIIVPESYGNCQNYDSEFKSEQNALLILNQLLELNNFVSSKYLLSGHSGAYRVLRRIFSISNLNNQLNSEIVGVALIDAGYSDLSAIIEFALNNLDFVFFNSFVSGEKGTTTKINNQLYNNYKNQNHFYIYPINSTSESVLDQHFKLIVRKGLIDFLKFFP